MSLGAVVTPTAERNWLNEAASDGAGTPGVLTDTSGGSVGPPSSGSSSATRIFVLVEPGERGGRTAPLAALRAAEAAPAGDDS